MAFIFQMTFLIMFFYENVWISIEILLKNAPKYSSNSIQVLF